jgi:hypothetical protein
MRHITFFQLSSNFTIDHMYKLCSSVTILISILSTAWIFRHDSPGKAAQWLQVHSWKLRRVVISHSFAFRASRHLKFCYKSIENACTAFPSTLVSLLELSPSLPILLLLRVGGLSHLNTRAIHGTFLHSRLKRKGDPCMFLALKSLSSHAHCPWCQPISHQKVTINLLLGLQHSFWCTRYQTASEINGDNPNNVMWSQQIFQE